MNQACKQCQATYEITDDDLAFYEKVSPVFGKKTELIPPPTLCPDCRMQKRTTWRNERTLYRRTCDLSGEKIISMYAPEKPFPVYQQKLWWSDDWDPLSYARDVDLASPFFPQFAELLHIVPQMSLYNVLCEQNCEYVNIEYDDKNCFMCFAGGYCEDCYYGTVVIRGKDCVDCQKLNLCERCYELSYSERCNTCAFSQDLHGCSDCFLCNDCHDCMECFGCAGLRNKRHCFFNEQLSKEAYEAAVCNVRNGSYENLRKASDRFRTEILPKTIRKNAHILRSEDCIGDYITNSGNCDTCFDIDESKDLKYVTLAEQLKDSRDCYITGWPAELCYESMSVCLNSYHCAFSNFCWSGCSDLYYCDHCFSCKNCFGCVGLRHKQYCILNKQYSKEEYEKFVPQIIERMRKTPLRSSGATEGQAGEWGEFFPVTMSPFAYNESIAQENFPLTKEDVTRRGWAWRDPTEEVPKVSKIIPAIQLPDAIEDVPDDILQWAIECEATKRPFRVIKQELEFYRSMKLPIPHLHPDERYRQRRSLRNPRHLWNRTCAHCKKPLATSYAPERPEIVCCEECYLKDVY